MTFSSLFGWEILAGFMAFLMSFGGCYLLRRFAGSFKFLLVKNEPPSVSLGGGLSWVGSVFFVLSIGICVTFFFGLPSEISHHQGGFEQKVPSLIWVCGGAFVMMIMGFLDDLQPIRPMVKVLVELVIAVVLALKVPEIRITAFVENEALNLIFTVFWIVLLTNVFNLLDHADGVSSVISLAIFLSLAILSSLTGQVFVYLLCLILLSALTGFLFHNWPPAALYMGDAGSLPLGYFVSIVTALFTFYSNHDPLTAVFMPLCLLIVPLYDSISVVILRMRQKRPIWVGDKHHVTHRFINSKWPLKKVLILFFLLTLLGGFFSALTSHLQWPFGFIPVVSSFLLILFIRHLEHRR